jgi:hypothetical protein
MPHSVNFQLQVSASARGEPVRQTITRAIVFFDSLDPGRVEQTAQRSVKSPGAELHAAGAHSFDILENGVTVAWLLREAQEDE